MMVSVKIIQKIKLSIVLIFVVITGGIMNKKELLKELEGLDDDAIIFVYANDTYYHIAGSEDKVAGVKMQNEITLICD